METRCQDSRLDYGRGSWNEGKFCPSQKTICAFLRAKANFRASQITMCRRKQVELIVMGEGLWVRLEVGQNSGVNGFSLNKISPQGVWSAISILCLFHMYVLHNVFMLSSAILSADFVLQTLGTMVIKSPASQSWTFQTRRCRCRRWREKIIASWGPKWIRDHVFEV